MERNAVNSEIKELMEEHNIRQWEVAREIGLTASAISNRLNKTMNEEQKETFRAAIDAIVKRREKMLSGEQKSDAIDKSCQALESLIEEMSKCIREGTQVIKDANEVIDIATRTEKRVRGGEANQYGYAPFNNRLRELVNDSPYTVKEIAQKLSVGESTLTAWMYRNAGIKIETLVTIADFFGVSLDYLTGRTGNSERIDTAEQIKMLAKTSYETYLKEAKSKKYLFRENTYVAPWPYNLLDEVYQPYDKEPQDDMEERVYKALDGLSPRERATILSYYKEEKTLEEVAKEFGVTRERIRQIIHKGIRKMRHPMRKRTIEYSEEEISIMRENESKKKEIEDLREELNKKLASLKRMGVEADNLKASAEADAMKVKGEDIEELELSIRSHNCLKRAGVETIGDLESLVQRDGFQGLIRVRNLGRKSIDEIFSKLAALTGKDWRDIAAEADERNERERNAAL